MLDSVCYVACNCNRNPTAAHWGPDHLICYASCNSIVIYDPNDGGNAVATLVQHTNRVNSVRWIKNNSSSLVSGSSDGTAIIWTKADNRYICMDILNDHKSSVTLVDGLSRDQSTAVVTVSVDCTGKIWKKDNVADKFTLTQTISFGYSICVGVRIAEWLNSRDSVLACALDNSTIQLYISNQQNKHQFSSVGVLKGHEDSVRGLDFTQDGENLILASSGQDMYIRMWRISKLQDQSDPVLRFAIKENEYSISIDSILMGHEGWIYSVDWHPNKLQLLSTSLDKSMIIWELESETNLWVEKLRVGDVGGNILGFYGGNFSPDGNSILGHGYNGAFHIWTRKKNEWEPSVTLGGHFEEVTDIAWEPKGEFLMSVSTDQTCRIHAPCPQANNIVTWHEIARPQIHGYDMSSLALISRYQYASSAEEKVIRTFRAPDDFIENFKRLCRIEDDHSALGVRGAAVPSLGLSNKAVYDDNKNAEDTFFTSISLDRPPTEETLLQNTLWPEVQKLYGHGYEVYSLAASPDGRLLASSCKATTREHAAIILWDSSNWQLVQKLYSHTLTVVQLAFSPDSARLLSVSRDRRWTLFEKRHDDNKFDVTSTVDKKTAIHTRIIWCCAWSHDSQYFATGSREGKLVIWSRKNNETRHPVLGGIVACQNHLDLKSESITAAHFAPDLIADSYMIAIGLETGLISIYKWIEGGNLSQVLTLDRSIAHHLTVRRVLFRPVFGLAGHGNNARDRLQLASCSADHSVKVYNLLI